MKYCFISITKEAFANIMKHSNATKVRLILREHPALYQLCVEDNGTGVSYDPGKSGIGILNMKERVNALEEPCRFLWIRGSVSLLRFPSNRFAGNKKKIMVYETPIWNGNSKQQPKKSRSRK